MLTSGQRQGASLLSSLEGIVGLLEMRIKVEEWGGAQDERVAILVEAVCSCCRTRESID